MSGQLDGRHRPQRSSSCAPVTTGDLAAAARSPRQRGGVSAGRQVVAGAAVLAGVATGPLHTPDLLWALLAFPWVGFLRLGRVALGTRAVGGSC